MAKTIIALLLLTLSYSAKAAPESVLYEGKAAAESSLTVGSWGAGSGQDSTAVYLFGGHSLRIITLDMHQGAQVAFTSPVELGEETGRYFQLTIRRGTPVLHYDLRTVPGAAPSPNPGPVNPGTGLMGMPPGMGTLGMGMPGMGFPTGTGTGGKRRHSGEPTAPAAPQIPPIKNLRLLFTLSDGRQADVLRPIPETGDPTVGEGWYSVNVALSALKFPVLSAAKAAEAPMLKSVTLGGDQYGVFYIGRIRLATDTAPITASIEGPASAFVGDDVALNAKADGGLSTLQYLWDFGTTGNALNQAEGMQTTTQYNTAAQDYTVTLTVTDQDGLKKPVQVTKVIHVTEEPARTQPGMPGTGIPGMGGFPAQP